MRLAKLVLVSDASFQLGSMAARVLSISVRLACSNGRTNYAIVADIRYARKGWDFCLVNLQVVDSGDGVSAW